MLHLDAASLVPLRPVAREAWLAAAEAGGNPASLHALGRTAARRLELARGQVAALLGLPPSGLTFTSGGTEALNLALRGALEALGPGRVLLGATEHKALLAATEALGPEHPVELLPVGRAGHLSPEALAEALERPGRVALVGAMAVNNETGAIAPIPALAALAQAAGARLLCDACQALAWAPEAAWAGADYLVGSGAKLGAGLGAGFVARRGGAPLRPLLRGGGQEQGLRPGTPNLPAIAALGAACAELRAGREAEAARLREGQAALAQGLEASCPELGWVLAEPLAAAPHLLALGLPGLRGEAALERLDLAGYAVGSGAACTALSREPSHVLRAMGLPEAWIAGSLRFSLSWASPGPEALRAAGLELGAWLRRWAATPPKAL